MPKNTSKSSNQSRPQACIHTQLFQQEPGILRVPIGSYVFDFTGRQSFILILFRETFRDFLENDEYRDYDIYVTDLRTKFPRTLHGETFTLQEVIDTFQRFVAINAQLPKPLDNDSIPLFLNESTIALSRATLRILLSAADSFYQSGENLCNQTTPVGSCPIDNSPTTTAQQASDSDLFNIFPWAGHNRAQRQSINRQLLSLSELFAADERMSYQGKYVDSFPSRQQGHYVGIIYLHHKVYIPDIIERAPQPLQAALGSRTIRKAHNATSNNIPHALVIVDPEDHMEALKAHLTELITNTYVHEIVAETESSPKQGSKP